ncbi:hypothetical protein OIU78_003476 [Salix suchowensis]|nr:hypothetical protein OIU78_003476 [Salix suchowensis]
MQVVRSVVVLVNQNIRLNFIQKSLHFILMMTRSQWLCPTKTGENYLCFLPKVEKAKSEMPHTQLNVSSMIVETEKRVKLKTPDELLEALKGLCFVRQEGWWSYELCYQQKLRQFHMEDEKEKVVQEFILGVYDEEATAAFNQNLSDISTLKDPRSKDASQRYHAHQYTNGTICDLTNEPRETEVRFVCSEPRAMISSITELSTCKYALTVHSPVLCKHPAMNSPSREEKQANHTATGKKSFAQHANCYLKKSNVATTQNGVYIHILFIAK